MTAPDVMFVDSSFCLGEWLVRPHQNTIATTEKVAHIEPNAMAVLVYLVQHAGEVVTKEQLVQSVWEGAFVTDEALSYAIWALRRALGDDAKKPLFIQTVPGKGYRLIARVEADSLFRLSLLGRRQWLFVAVAAVVGGLLFFKPSSRDAIPTGSKPSLAVPYFENLSRDPELDWLRAGLTEMLVTDLSQSPDLEILSTDRLYRILNDMDRVDEASISEEVVQQVAEKAGVETVLVGSFMRAGDNIRINIRIQDATNGEILATESVEGVGGRAYSRWSPI